MGQSWPMTFMPPTPRYWPSETSRKKSGMPHVSRARK